MGFVSNHPVQETPNGILVTFTTSIDFLGDVLITIGGLFQSNYTKDDPHTFTFDAAPTALMGTILVHGYAGDALGTPTLGPWSLADFYSIYAIDGDSFHPARNVSTLDTLIAYVMTDVITDHVTALTQAIYDTYTTDFAFATKLKRSLALCTIKTLHDEHGLIALNGIQLATEAISDFSSVSYRYPSLDTDSFLEKTRDEIIKDTLADDLPGDSPVLPSSRTPAHGAFVYFTDVENQTW